MPLRFLRLTAVLCILSPALFAQMTIFEQPLSPRIANYRIDVRLDAEKRLLHGSQMMLWHNKSGEPVPDLQFHLYLNGFRNNQTTFWKESGGQHRGNEASGQGWGFSDPQHIKILPVAGGTGALNFSDPANHPRQDQMLDLTSGISYRSPDDGNPHDRSVMQLPLAAPLAPGDSIWIQIDFIAQLPSPPFARTGNKEEYFMIGQWFPKIAVFEKGNWNCHQFHYNTEFYADFGVYDVFMTVPAPNLVGATGLEVSVRDNGDGSKTHYYHAEDVHDFAWTTSPDFLEYKSQAQDVAIRLLLQPDRKHQAERQLEAMRQSIVYFQDWYGDYPFPNITLVDPRRGALGSGGMEYPTFVTGVSHAGIPEGAKVPEMVIIHEFGHNFWYHLLASNEFEESWLDEGINTYTEIMIMEALYKPGASLLDLGPFKLSGLAQQRLGYITGADFDPTVKLGWEYYNGGSYATNSYSKPGIFLVTLHNYLGQETMQKIIQTYVARFSFKHPTSQDFVDVASEVAGQDLAWFFDQALYTNHVLDYAVSSAKSKKVSLERGYDFDLDSKDPYYAKRDEAKDENSDEDKDAVYRTEVKVRRKGAFTFPVEVLMTFEDGEIIRENWDGKDLWVKYVYARPSRLVSATVDPDFKIPMDVNLFNNSFRIEPETRPAVRATTGLMGLLQNLVEVLAL